MLALLSLTITLLLIFIDPNDYKVEIQDQVKQSINRDLHIKGDIGWTFFPQFGFSSGEIELDNLAGFNKKHLIKIKQVSLGINILPLLKGEISIGELTIDGFELTLLTDKKGLSNLDNMGITPEKESITAPTKKQTQKSTEEKTTSFFDLSKTQLAGININNAIIELEDLQTGSYQKISINEVKFGEFALGKETELIINTKVIIDDLQAEFKLHALLLVSQDLATIKLNKLQLNSLLTTPDLPNGQLKSLLKTDITYLANSQQVTISNIDINTVITGDNLPNKKIDTQFTANINYQLKSKKAEIKQLKLKVDKIELAGNVSVQTASLIKVRYKLEANKWDLTPYMAKENQSEKTDNNTGTATSTEPAIETEPDLSFLNGLDIDGHLKIAGLKIDNIQIGEINKHLIINKGKAQLKPLTAQLYQGLLTMNGEVRDNKGKNNYQISTKLKGVEIHQLLIDAAEIDLISGNSSFNFSGKGQGLSATKIKQGLVGKGNFTLLDGELYGVNIPQEIRTLKAKFTGKKAPTSDSIKKTDFASLTGNFSINKGLVNNQKLLMLSPVMRLDGSGLVHILKETLDYKLSISPLSKSKADTHYIDLGGLTIPLLIKGSFSDPKFSLDTDSALKEQLKAKAKILQKEAKAKFQAEQQRLQEKMDNALKKHQDKLDAETQEKIKKETERLTDKLKKFF